MAEEEFKEPDLKKIKKEPTYEIQRKEVTVFGEADKEVEGDLVFGSYEVQITDAHKVTLPLHLYIKDLEDFKKESQELIKNLFVDLLNDYEFVDETNYVDQLKKILER